MEIEEIILNAKTKKLRDLNLSDLGLKDIPIQLSGLENIENLNLNGNPFVTIDFDFSKIPNLRVLSLNNCQLTGIPKSIYNLNKLTYLNLNRNELNIIENGILPISLKSIDLSSNLFDNVPDQLFKNNGILEISMRSNQITSLSLKSLNCEGFSKLNLSKNKISDISFLTENLNLNVLDISSNDLDFFPNRLWNIKNLRVLNISDNQITHLPKCPINTEISVLKISKNRIFEIDESVLTKNPIRELDISFNKFERLPKHICSMKNLQKLDFSSNIMSQFPENILGLDLNYCTWKNNSFTEYFDRFSDFENYFIHKINMLASLNYEKLISSTNDGATKIDTIEIDHLCKSIIINNEYIQIEYTNEQKSFKVSKIKKLTLEVVLPAKGWGSLNIFANYTDGTKRSLLFERKNLAKRRYEFNRIISLLSKSLKLEFEEIYCGHDC